MSLAATTVRIATRSSPLATWQAMTVATLLNTRFGIEADLVSLVTDGDRRTDRPLSEIGGKGVFVTEVQAAVLEGRADIAVHSAKDMPATESADLRIGAFLAREDPRDAVVGAPLDSLEPGSLVATGSPRRRAQLRRHYPHLEVVELRGNIATRLSKVGQLPMEQHLHDRRIASILVAHAALVRLGNASAACEVLDVDRFIPQVGQGIVAVECRSDRTDLADLLRPLADTAGTVAATAERAFLAELGGDCRLPAAAHAEVDASGAISLSAMLATGDGGTYCEAQRVGSDALELGRALAAELRGRIQ